MHAFWFWFDVYACTMGVNASVPVLGFRVFGLHFTDGDFWNCLYTQQAGDFDLFLSTDLCLHSSNLNLKRINRTMKSWVM